MLRSRQFTGLSDRRGYSLRGRTGSVSGDVCQQNQMYHCGWHWGVANVPLTLHGRLRHDKLLLWCR